MLEKLTDNVKLFIVILLYVVYITWWASGMNSTQQQVLKIQENVVVTQRDVVISQGKVSEVQQKLIETASKTTELIDKHLEECAQRRANILLMKQEINHIREDIDRLHRNGT